MILHRNARTCPHVEAFAGGSGLVEGWSLAAAAEAAGVSERTAWKWSIVPCEGEQGLDDRSSVPRRCRSRTPADREELIAVVARVAVDGREIAESLGMPLSTASVRSWPAIGLGKLPRLKPAEPANSYERPTAGRAASTLT